MIKFNHKKETDDEVKVNLMPLIDIIFNLLIFFMITAAITTKGISIDLPEAKTSEKMPIKSWDIVINENQEILLPQEEKFYPSLRSFREHRIRFGF